MSYSLIVGGDSAIGQALIQRSQILGLSTISTSRRKINNSSIDDLRLFLDLESDDSIDEFSKTLSRMHIRLNRIFFCAAFVHPYQPPVVNNFLEYIPPSEIFSKSLAVNCYSFLRLVHTIINEQCADSYLKICALSSVAGSISLRGRALHNLPGGNLAYRISKTALNSAVKNVAYDLQHAFPDMVVLAVHPGWVKTALGGSDAPLEPSFSAKMIMNLLQKSKPENSGEFFNYDGNILEY